MIVPRILALPSAALLLLCGFAPAQEIQPRMGAPLSTLDSTQLSRFGQGKLVFDTNLMDDAQLAWIDATLGAAREPWKICYFHHPLYSDGGTHGSAIDVRVVFEPLFVTYGVNVVFAGHDHIYERITPQKGIYHFVEGASGQLRKGDANRSPMNAKSFDQDMSFMLVEIDGNQMSFQAISRTGATVDVGKIQRQLRPAH